MFIKTLDSSKDVKQSQPGRASVFPGLKSPFRRKKGTASLTTWGKKNEHGSQVGLYSLAHQH